jgi:hypothetical protein
MAAGLDRLKRIAGHAERRGALVLLEHLNKEPDEVESGLSRISPLAQRNG